MLTPEQIADFEDRAAKGEKPRLEWVRHTGGRMDEREEVRHDSDVSWWWYDSDGNIADAFGGVLPEPPGRDEDTYEVACCLMMESLLRDATRALHQGSIETLGIALQRSAQDTQDFLLELDRLRARVVELEAALPLSDQEIQEANEAVDLTEEVRRRRGSWMKGGKP